VVSTFAVVFSCVGLQCLKRLDLILLPFSEGFNKVFLYTISYFYDAYLIFTLPRPLLEMIKTDQQVPRISGSNWQKEVLFSWETRLQT